MSICYEEGNAIKGDQIAAVARKVSKPRTIVQTGAHKATRIILTENAFCRIVRKSRFLPQS